MEAKGQNFQEAMLEILKSNKANEMTIKKFLKDTNELEMPFQAVISALKEREGLNWHLKK